MPELRTRDGRRLAYRRRGTGPLVVGHPGGPGFEAESLRDLGGLDADHELVLLDPRGAGASDPPHEGTYELDGYVADLAELLDHLDETPTALLGHSHGGLVALLAASRGARVERLVLVATPTHVDDATYDRLGSVRRSRSGSARGQTPDPGGQHVGRTWGRTDEAFDDGLGDEGISSDAVEYFNRHVIQRFDLRPVCAHVTVPTLVVCGRDDPAAGPAASTELVRLLPDAELAIIESSGHVPYIENGDAFAAAVRDFLGT